MTDFPPARIAESPMSLAKFDRPPVNEVIFDISFEIIPDFTSTTFGILWLDYKDEYPQTQDMPPLMQAGMDKIMQAGMDKISPFPQRVWFIHNDDSRVIQLQRDRFIFNWRKREADYPSFETVFPEFRENFQKFQDCLVELGLSPVQPTAFELKYINVIPQGEGWMDFSQISNVMPDLNWRRSNRFLPTPADMKFAVRFPLPESNGNLTVSLLSGRSKKNQEVVLQLDFVANVAKPKNGIDACYDWFQLAHEWIVKGFEDITNSVIQRDVWAKRT